MNAEIKAQWTSALRSGKYKQGKGYLRVGDCFCPLGVLIDILDPSEWRAPSVYEVTSVFSCRFSKQSLPYDMAKKCELDLKEETKVMDLNDDDNLSFADIANWIEVNL